MQELMVLIILLGGGGGDAGLVDQAFAAQLGQLGGYQTHHGAAVSEVLREHDLAIEDLHASEPLIDALTRQDPRLVVVMLDAGTQSGDTLIESRVFLRGQQRSHVAIAGPDGNALAQAAEGVHALIRRLGSTSNSSTDAAATDANATTQSLASLAQQQRWAAMLRRVASWDAEHEWQAKERYYHILALVQSGHDAAAREALAAFAEADGQHLLYHAAEGLVPSSPEPQTAKEPDLLDEMLERNQSKDAAAKDDPAPETASPE